MVKQRPSIPLNRLISEKRLKQQQQEQQEQTQTKLSEDQESPPPLEPLEEDTNAPQEETNKPSGSSKMVPTDLSETEVDSLRNTLLDRLKARRKALLEGEA
jgi:hypothetical protein